VSAAGQQQVPRTVPDWLRVECGLDKPSRKLQSLTVPAEALEQELLNSQGH